MAWFFNRKEKRSDDMQPHKEVVTSACDEAIGGLGLLQKLLKLNGYGALSQSPFFAGINLISNGVAQMGWEVKSLDGTDIPSNFYVIYACKEPSKRHFASWKWILLYT